MGRGKATCQDVAMVPHARYVLPIIYYICALWCASYMETHTIRKGNISENTFAFYLVSGAQFCIPTIRRALFRAKRWWLVATGAQYPFHHPLCRGC